MYPASLKVGVLDLRPRFSDFTACRLAEFCNEVQLFHLLVDLTRWTKSIGHVVEPSSFPRLDGKESFREKGKAIIRRA